MSEPRCQECGSWDRACSSPTPVIGCGCARCLSATVDSLKKEIDELKMLMRAARMVAAERQRDACAKLLREEYAGGNVDHVSDLVQRTPLVIEERA